MVVEPHRIEQASYGGITADRLDTGKLARRGLSPISVSYFPAATLEEYSMGAGPAIQSLKIFKSFSLQKNGVCTHLVRMLIVSALTAFGSYPTLAAEAEPPLYGMTVSGKRPGPPLWKVTNGDNVLWIFGTLRYLPKRLDWDSSSVSFILSETDSYISPPSVTAFEWNPFKAISLLRKMKRHQRIPDGQTLEDILSPLPYTRFLEARELYAPKDNEILTLRPAEASSRLLGAAREFAGLRFDKSVGDDLRRMARRRRAEIVDHDRSLDIDDFLAGYENIQLEDEVACLESRLETIHTDIGASVERANAWANGDAGLLLELDYPDPDAFCGIALFKSDAVQTVVEQTRADWITAVDEALNSDAVSFASFPMREIVHPEGLLAKLRQRGYLVTGQ